MRKTLSMLVMESEKEYKLRLKSVVNVHDQSHLDRITSALMGHQVHKVEATEIIPYAGKIDSDLPNAPGGFSTYVVDIVLGMKAGERELTELICLHTGIEKENFCLKGDMVLDESKIEQIDDLDTSEEEKKAQDEVGQKRLGAFMDEYRKARKDRDAKIKTRPVYEAFCVGSDEVRSLLRESMVGRGYWMVRAMDDTKQRLSVTGPYTNIPVGLAIVEGVMKRMKPSARPLSINHGNLTEYVLDLADNNWAIMENRPYEVRVKDTRSGRTYTAAVQATDDVQARNLGLEQVKSQEGISGDTLLALDPTD